MQAREIATGALVGRISRPLPLVSISHLGPAKRALAPQTPLKQDPVGLHLLIFHARRVVKRVDTVLGDGRQLSGEKAIVIKLTLVVVPYAGNDIATTPVS